MDDKTWEGYQDAVHSLPEWDAVLRPEEEEEEEDMEHRLTLLVHKKVWLEGREYPEGTVEAILALYPYGRGEYRIEDKLVRNGHHRHGELVIVMQTTKKQDKTGRILPNPIQREYLRYLQKRKLVYAALIDGEFEPKCFGEEEKPT